MYDFVTVLSFMIIISNAVKIWSRRRLNRTYSRLS